MTQIEIVSASAGSGKTFHLAGVLEKALLDGEARPEAIVATTFTIKAAAELRERVRRRLLRADRAVDAQRLGASRIGTVHAVCGKLVREHAFLLGMSPEQRVLDDETGNALFQQALAEVVSLKESEELSELSYRFKDLDWRKAVRSVVGLARSNWISPKQLEEHARRSVESIGTLLGDPVEAESTLEADLLTALEGFRSGYDPTVDATKCTAAAATLVEQMGRRLASGGVLTWWDWARLSNLRAGAKSRDLCAPINEAARAHDRHPRLRCEIERFIELVFGVSARALEAYQDAKRRWGAIDFEDQEVLALRLLRLEEVRERLREDIDLVLIDEFQDTSPIQLAIFLELANVARRSVWVGDQKQAIFAFRGTDPALMDAAVETILRGREPERLEKSWRSRPLLVELTSSVFGEAFAGQGIPAERVHLEAALTNEPEGLGAPLERWCLSTKNAAGDARALAGLVRELLADSTVLVRDLVTKQARPVRASDLAVLCRANDTCARVADALEALGVKAELPRKGLLATAEAIYVLAALRLWVDPRDALAAAQFARLVRYADREDAFLEDALAQPKSKGFLELCELQAIETARIATPLAGAVAALDAVLHASEVREHCLTWGDSEQRLANLEALRAHAVTYVAGCSGRGAGSTPAGLVAHLLELADKGNDTQGHAAHADAVGVRTWHSCKGLEWPITVLFELHKDYTRSAMGVNVASDRDTLDLADPMGSRWIRYWPWPYGPQRRVAMANRLAADPAEARARTLGQQESLRVLYVAWTRARDRLVLAGRKNRFLSGTLAHLRAPDGTALISEPSEQNQWGETVFPAVIRNGGTTADVPQEPQPGIGYVYPEPCEHAPAVFNPSSAKAQGRTCAPERIGPRLELTKAPDMRALGEAVHAFLAADRLELDAAERLSSASGLLRRWDVSDSLRPADLLSASERLVEWAKLRWPQATWRRELHIQMRLDNGSRLRGIADLVLEQDSELAVIDHKSFPGSEAQAVERAAGYAGQLACYANALTRALGKPTTAQFIHLPILGLVVPVAHELCDS
jgi:ATP-dependent helicase/nuclease subunit A